MSTENKSSFQAIIEPVVRLAQALDDNDLGLFVSCFTPDASSDMRGFNDSVPPPPKPFGVLNGVDVLVERVLNHVGPGMDTTHMLSNIRITRAWSEGGSELRQVEAYALAQHFRRGEGQDASKKGVLMGNRWRLEVVKMVGEVDEVLGEDRWRIRSFAPWNMWSEGDASVIGAAWKEATR